MKNFFVYILSSYSRALYVGITSDIQKRVRDHRLGVASAHTAKYRIRYPVYFETYSDPHVAIARETEIKAWRREKKIALIEAVNPMWRDMYEEQFC